MEKSLNKMFLLNGRMENELQQLKQELLKEPILHHFNPERETRIYTDA